MHDRTKRMAVRHLLLQEQWANASDREVAREAGVSRQLVGAVRRLMMAAGEVSEKKVAPHTPGHVSDRLYKPGTAVRGGYVYDDDGRPVRDTVYAAKQAAKKRKQK